MNDKARALAQASYYGEVRAFNYVIANWPVELQEIIDLRDCMLKTGESIGKHGVEIIIP